MGHKAIIKLLAVSFFILIFVVACGVVVANSNRTPTNANPEPTSSEDQAVDEGTASVAHDKTSASDGGDAERTLLAGTNIAKHNVPLEDVHFDTFDGRSIVLADADEALVLRLRDAIPPIAEPQYESVKRADEWLTDEDRVVGYVDGDIALAYPIKILNFHEIVNEIVNDIPILVSYCPLCDSGIVYDRRLNNQALEFGNTSALYESDLVMYDKQTFSYWYQVGGQAIVGDLTGERLAVLPTRFMRWDMWREMYPDSQILSRDTGFSRPYQQDPFTNLVGYLDAGRFPFPVNESVRNSTTLSAGERIVSLTLNNEARAYPLMALAGQIANDQVGGVPVAVTVDEVGTAYLFDRRVGNRILTLSWSRDGLKDAETGSQWSLAGEATSGVLAGEQLILLPSRFSFWFAFVASFPEGTVYQPDEN